MRCAPLLALALAACSGDIQVVEAENDPPAVSLSTDKTSYLNGEEVILTAIITDDRTPYADIAVGLDVTDADLTGPVAGEGEAGIWTWSLLADNADATLTVTATDDRDAATNESITLDIADNSAPSLSFGSPDADERFAEGATVTIEVTVADAEDVEQDLALTWSGLSDLSMAPAAPDASGFATFDLTGLALGTYTLQATVTDTLDAEVSRSITFSLIDPDGDNDGDLAIEFGGTDCDDEEAAVNGSAEEVCDTLDNDCDGTADNNATNAPSWFADVDLDTYGDPATEVRACNQPVGTIARGGDCDDNQGAAYPTNTEICDGIDNDCLNGPDDGLTTTLFYLDNDSDDWGSGTPISACVAPPNHVAQPGDCDDGNTNVNPDATETCNGINDDCNNGIDEGLPTTVWYYDGDSDNYGVATNSQTTCDTVLADHVEEAGDCNDNDNSIYPNAADDCNGVNNDCDGDTDEDSPPPTWYADTDNDTYGDANATREACTQPNRYVTDNSDCNDNNNSIYPNQADDCNDVDNDCDGSVDEDEPPTLWYRDSDIDTYGDRDDSVSACTQPAGRVADDTDCDDNANATHPNATETCNGIDDDCADGVDEGFTLTDYFYDFDQDDYGIAPALPQCSSPGPDWATVGGDCNDNNITVHPNATDDCDTVDTDCDGPVDEDMPPTQWFFNNDGDSFGDAAVSTFACTQPANYLADDTDCDDDNSAIYPGATEVCNGVSDDCDTPVDEGVPTNTYYRDADGDGHGVTTNTVDSCSQPFGYVASSDDCNDVVAAGGAEEWPGNAEVCEDGYDNDCLDGDESCGVDYTGIWDLYIPGSNTPRTVAYGCDSWGFSFGAVQIIDSSPIIEVIAGLGDPTLNRVNGCEWGDPTFCSILGSDLDGMPGWFESNGSPNWVATEALIPAGGNGYEEHYGWQDIGASNGWATFVDDDTFEASFRWWFANGSVSGTVPGDCVDGTITVEGRRR
ncbi:MAG: putative metal-binding motif-containing protein [Proteobacteria bacterium]|nr:putative metal-binding motif-containing protein [Pseudomonadota bacterium]